MVERQVPAATDNHPSNQASSLAAAMGASLRRYCDERTGYQTFLYAAGVLLLGSGLFHTLVFLPDGGGWDGPLSWRKPILFGFSFGITVLSLEAGSCGSCPGGAGWAGCSPGPWGWPASARSS